MKVRPKKVSKKQKARQMKGQLFQIGKKELVLSD